MFEHSLIDMEIRPRPRRWLSLPIAVVLHLVALATFTFASYWNVSEVPEPATNVVFFSVAPAPMPKLGGGTPKPVETRQEEIKPADPQTPVQPVPDAVPDEVPAPAPVPDSTPATGFDFGPGVPEGPGVPWGDPDGDEDAVVPGDGPGTGDGPGVGGKDQEEGPVYITVGITRPEILRKVEPRYTELARRAGVQGTVIIEAIIDEKGNVTGQRILKSQPMGLDQAAMEAIR